jgi:hypothetical protein
VPGTSSRVAPSTSNPDVVSAGRDVADMKKNAIITSSKQTPEHSQVLTPNSFQSIVNPQKKSDKSKKKVSVNDWAVVLKTKLFIVKHPSTRNDKNVLHCIFFASLPEGSHTFLSCELHDPVG